MSRIIISGGGIAGLTTAIALKQIGFHPLVCEAAPEIKPVGAGLALAANAIRAFKKLGIDDAVMAKGRLLNAFTIKDEKGRIITKTDSLTSSEKYGADNFTIHRADLHRVLMSFLDKQEVQTNKRCIDFEKIDQKVLLHFSDGSSETADYLIAADGIHSPVRKKLLPSYTIRYSGYTCWRSVIDIPSADLKEASETWGTRGRFGIVPLAHDKLYWFACIKARPDDERMKHYTVKELLQHFGNYHQPIPEILHKTKDEDLIWNDISDLPPLPRFSFENILLIGDAAHATTPNMGQGACQAIEDAVILADCIQKVSSVSAAFSAFEKRRMDRTHYIVKQSRMIGNIAQIQNKYVACIRNAFMRSIPAKTREQQLDKVLRVDF